MNVRASITNRTQENKEKCPGSEDRIEEMDTLIKENVKYK